MESKTKNMVFLDLEMSNLGQKIDSGFEKALREKPAFVYGQHSAWNFCGNVYFENGEFFEEVWIYHQLVDIFKAPSLEELMTLVCNTYGYE